MKGVSYARFLTTLCLVSGVVKQGRPQEKANAFKSKSSHARSVQYRARKQAAD